MTRAPQLGLQHGEAARMWKEQVKWVLLWFTLSLLTCMHSAALILALQYNLIAVVRPPLISIDASLQYNLVTASANSAYAGMLPLLV